ncbi:ArsR family transcriptional regulator, partial [mine drainage metagenome]
LSNPSIRSDLRYRYDAPVRPIYAVTDIYPFGNIRAVSDVFQLLAEPSRRRLLDALRYGERSVNELAELSRMPQPSVSKQLRVLLDSGLVRLRKSGRQHLYS